MEPILNTDELCRYLQAAASTIIQYNREGMPRFFVGKESRYLASEVILWLKRRSLYRITPSKGFDPKKEIEYASKCTPEKTQNEDRRNPLDNYSEGARAS